MKNFYTIIVEKVSKHTKINRLRPHYSLKVNNFYTKILKNFYFFERLEGFGAAFCQLMQENLDIFPSASIIFASVKK